MPRIHRSVLVAPAAALAALLVLAPAPSPAAKKVPKSCDKLTGPIVIQTPQAKIVKRRYRDVPRRVRRGVTKDGFVGKRFYGCALPDGKVHKLGSKGTTYLYERDGRPGKVRRAGIYGTSDMTFFSPVGTFVLSHSQDGIAGGPSAGTYLSGLVQDLATGDRYPYWDNDSANPNTEFVNEPPSKVILSEQGRLAAIFDDDLNDQRSVRGFGASGSQQVLDTVPTDRREEIPLDSLDLTGTTVTWTNAGQPRSAELMP